MGKETIILIQRAAAELKTAGATEIYVFGSIAKGTRDAISEFDLAVSGRPPSVIYRMGERVIDLIGRSFDLIDLDINAPFTAAFARRMSSTASEKASVMILIYGMKF